MPLLQIRDLPDELYEALRRKAAEERRSLSQQAIVTLSKGSVMKSTPRHAFETRSAALPRSIPERPGISPIP